MKLLKLLLAASLLQFGQVWAQEDANDVNVEEEWSEEAPIPAATPMQLEDAAGEEEMPVYEESVDY